MGQPNANATLMGGPGGGVTLDELQTMCEAFAAAVDNFCRQENIDSRKRSASDPEKEMYDRRGRFNDYFYRSLARRDRNLAGRIRREVGGVFQRGSGDYLGTINQVARGRGAGGALISADERAAAQFMRRVMRGSRAYGRTGARRFLDTALDKMRGATVGAFRNAGSVTQAMRDAVYTRWTDGTLPSGRVVELKGPKDTPRPGQLDDAKKMGRGMDPVVVSCESCGLDCANGCPGT
ncbi:hypothetical protein [Sorangium sp. So ce854]|uniref:hypothetical protein n=1 Tax=Sorangium sp. So ce854 TaxID=3133322 RepID=UPI003F639382